VETVCKSVSIPVAVKLLPFITSLSNLASRLRDAGAKGIVLFGREPIWEIFDGALTATSRWSLSDSGQLQTTLSGLLRVRGGGEGLSIAASGGISTAKDVIHSVIAGADCVMVTSEIYRTGPDVVTHILEGVTQYLDRQGLTSFNEFVAKCRSSSSEVDTRQSQVQAMMDTHRYRDPHPQQAIRTCDKWGHVSPTPAND
jgi:dihydroorotate dehydrogenase (fumarate)